MKKYSENEIREQLKRIEGWSYKDGRISREVILKDFMSVISIVNKIASEAEGMNHHPDILVHTWNKVRFMLSTHSESGITERDFVLAGKINNILGSN